MQVSTGDIRPCVQLSLKEKRAMKQVGFEFFVENKEIKQKAVKNTPCVIENEPTMQVQRIEKEDIKKEKQTNISTYLKLIMVHGNKAGNSNNIRAVSEVKMKTVQ